MTDNRLKLNPDKSHLLVFCSSQARARTQCADLVKIETDDETIKPSKSEKLLGCRIQDDFKWTEHLRDNEESLIKSLNVRLNALKIISRISDFKTRKMFANGFFHSKLIYMISVWSSCTKDLVNAIQILQNRAARIITKNSWDISSKENLNQVGWLSVNQLAQYQSVILLHKVKLFGSPNYMKNMYNWNYSYQTRQAESKKLRPIGTPKLEIGKRSFRWRASQEYNSLPEEITQIEDIISFKIQAKKWIMMNVPIKK